MLNVVCLGSKIKRKNKELVTVKVRIVETFEKEGGGGWLLGGVMRRAFKGLAMFYFSIRAVIARGFTLLFCTLIYVYIRFHNKNH